VSLTALAGPSIQADVEYADLVGVIVQYERSRFGLLGATISDPLFTPSGTNSIRVVGERGGLTFDVATGRLDWQVTDGQLQHLEIETENSGLDGALAAELANFADVIQGSAAPFVLPDEALRAVELCEAAERSILSGAVVHLPWEDGDHA
jgi:predicted dehydrogenase